MCMWVAFRPAQLNEVRTAVLVRREPPLELGKRARVIFHAADTLPIGPG